MNMNRLALPLAIIAVVASIATFFVAQQQNEPVYVDVNRLLEGYERTKVERTAFEKKAGDMRADVDSLLVGWQDELKAYEKERSKMSKKEIELKQQLLQNKQQQISGYQQSIQKKIQEEDQKMTQTVINDINDYIKEYGKNNGHKIIFGAQGSGNIMYADAGTDLTDKVLEGLNQQYHGK